MTQQPKALPHLRVAALGNIIDLLNVWAMEPSDEHRREGLRAALNRYAQAVKEQKYLPMNKDFCAKTPACDVPPPVAHDSFEAYFGSPEQDTGDKLPWD